MENCKLKLCLLLFSLLLLKDVDTTHISGTFKTKDFFKFLIKFGFQKTDLHRQNESYGYIFGNVTSKTNFSRNITLAVLDRNHFLEYYENRMLKDKKFACANMFKTLNQSSYDMKCNDNGQDYLRFVTKNFFFFLYISI